MDDISKAVCAIDDMNKAGALRVRIPNTWTVSQATKDAFGEPIKPISREGLSTKVVDPDGTVRWAPLDPRIHAPNPDYSGCFPPTMDELHERLTMKEAIETNFRVALSHAAKIAADLDGNPYQADANMKQASQGVAFRNGPVGSTEPLETPKGLNGPAGPSGVTQEVPFIRGGHYEAADAERYGCRLIWWPDELRPPFFEGKRGSRTLHMTCPTSGMPTHYDISYDERRPITQDIVDNMERGIQRLISERHEIRADKDAEIALLRQALAMKDARIAQLDTRLASIPVAFEDPDATPEPEHNPFRDFGHDPRRMGP